MQELIAYIVKKVVEERSEELKELGQDITKLKKIKVPFPRMKYAEVLKFLKQKEKKTIP